MDSHICIFEDEKVAGLFPLVYFRPVFDLRCGAFSLKEKIERAYPKANVSVHCRPYLADVMRERYPGLPVNDVPRGNCLFINGRVIADPSFGKKIPLIQKSDAVFIKGATVVAARVSGARLAKLRGELRNVFTPALVADLPRTEVDVTLVSYPWDLVHQNGAEIARDFETLTGKKKKSGGRKPAGVYFLGKKGVFVDRSATIKPGVVLDAGEGPIYIGKNVTILPFSSIVGPVYIGDGSLIKAGATIYGNTSIGPVCKIGGEVEGTIVHGYSNKQHSGFLGHSYVCPWVNLGAGTNNSDLKNNYSTVKVQLGGEQIDTGLQFVGLTMGDHSKSAINSMFNTGTVVGVCSNVFGSGFPPKFIPSYSWGGGEAMTTYDVGKAVGVARKVMARRTVDLTKAEELLFRKVFELTDEDRQRSGMKS